MKLQRHITAIVGLLSSLLALSPLAPSAAAQSIEGNAVPSLVEVYWQWSRTITTPALTNIIVLDQEIARVEPSLDGLQIYGLERGETVLQRGTNHRWRPIGDEPTMWFAVMFAIPAR